MEAIVTLLVATTALASGDIQNSTRQLIVGGTIVPPGTKTYTATLRDSSSSTAYCGGTLISPTHVLTSAQCTNNLPFKINVLVGSHYRTQISGGQVIGVKRIIQHPNYSDYTVTYDYSILELDSPSTIPPVKLYSADPQTFLGQTVVVMGWGATRDGGSMENELHAAQIGLVDDAICRAAYANVNAITPTMFCAGLIETGGKDACQGDGGGPLILEQPNQDVLVGVISWGSGCARPRYPGVYSKVSYVKSWIQANAPTAQWV